MRFEDWPARLDAFIASRLQTPFEWGKNDCCLFACDGVAAMTGTDPAAPFRLRSSSSGGLGRGRYKTKRGAFAMLKRFAGGGLEEAAERIARELGAPEIPPLMAQRGDVVIIETALGPALGLRLASGIAAATTPTGILVFSAAAAKRAWRV